MPKKISKEEAEKILSSAKKGGKRDVQFGKEIDELKKGEKLHITAEEWKATGRKTKIGSYYYGKFRKGIEEKDRTIKYQEASGGLVITKLGKSGIICLMTGHTKIGPIPMLTKKGEERLYSFCLECKKEWFTK